MFLAILADFVEFSRNVILGYMGLPAVFAILGMSYLLTDDVLTLTYRGDEEDL